jgi:hypothetical protein
VRALAAGDAWITEWQYADARPILLARAQLVVWLDLPTAVTMARVVRRTVVRRLRRLPLWSAENIEPPLWTVFTQRDHIVRWAWRTRRKYRVGPTSLPRRLAGRPDIALVRLRSRRAVEQWLATIG